MNAYELIVGGAPYTVTQGFGHTPWSVGAGRGLYAYGLYFCLDGITHPGVDLTVALNAPLYSPVAGTVLIAGGTSVFTDERFGNKPHTGQLKIQRRNGDHLILGHMAHITVDVGDRVEQSQLVGTMGTNNGVHVHVEYRISDTACRAGQRIIDPWLGLYDVSGPGPGPIDPTPPNPPNPPPDGGSYPHPPGTPLTPVTDTGVKGIAERIDNAERINTDSYLSNWRGLSVRAVEVLVGALLLRQGIKHWFEE